MSIRTHSPLIHPDFDSLPVLENCHGETLASVDGCSTSLAVGDEAPEEFGLLLH
jgi:hypothetical protein